MPHRSSVVIFCLAALSVVSLAAPAAADSAFTADATLTYLGDVGPNGEARYRYDYTVLNNAIEPDVGAFQVFFNSDPVTQLPTGDHATLVSYGSPAGWEMVTVIPKNAEGQWSLNWDWDYATLPEIVPGASLSGFSVVFDWNDPSSLPPAQHVQARNGSAHSGVTVVRAISSIAGTVNGDCGSRVGLVGVTVDLFAVDGQGVETMVASTATNTSGQFFFGNLAPGTYHVVIVTPLGYVADANIKVVDANEPGVTFTVDFTLTCQNIAAEPRTIGYWKHQVNSYLTGKGKAQESLSAMLGYIDLILEHFNQNITNPIVIYVPEASADPMRKLDQLLTVNKNGTMLDRAKQQLLALLLNVVSGKIAQTQVISPNGATVSQAITYANDLMQSGDRALEETAKTIVDLINNGQPVPSGMVPASTRVITYNTRPAGEDRGEFRLDAAAPNPASGPISIGFALSRPGPVELRIFDVAGRAVKALAAGSFEAGAHRLGWDGTDTSGARVQPGVYFYRLVTEEGTLTRRVSFER